MNFFQKIRCDEKRKIEDSALQICDIWFKFSGFRFSLVQRLCSVCSCVFFKGCHICFKPIRNSAKDVHKFLFKLEEFANLQPKKLRTCLAFKHAAVIDYISVPRFLSCFGRFSRIVTNFYHLAINYCMVQLFCFTVLQISPSTTSAYKVPYFLE